MMQHWYRNEDNVVRLLGRAEFGAIVLIGKDMRHSTSNNGGLPTVSSSVRMLGRFPFIASLSQSKPYFLYRNYSFNNL